MHEHGDGIVKTVKNRTHDTPRPQNFVPCLCIYRSSGTNINNFSHLFNLLAMLIYRTPNSYQITRSGYLFTCDQDLKHFRKVTQITDRFVPSGVLVRNPSKRLIFYFQNKINDTII